MASTANGRRWGRRVAVALVWLVTVVEAFFMVLAGQAKFTRPDAWTGFFVEFGYAPWFSYVVGAAEVVAALLLLVPRLAAYAALLLVGIMFGALHAVTTHDSSLGVDGPLLHLAFLAVILAVRWRRRWRPRSPSPTGR